MQVNIGGGRFKLDYNDIIKHDNGAVLSRLCSPEQQKYSLTLGEFFFDRDPDSFKLLLDVANGKVDPDNLSKLTRSFLRNDALYYEFNAIAASIPPEEMAVYVAVEMKGKRREEKKEEKEEKFDGDDIDAFMKKKNILYYTFEQDLARIQRSKDMIQKTADAYREQLRLRKEREERKKHEAEEFLKNAEEEVIRVAKEEEELILLEKKEEAEINAEHIQVEHEENEEEENDDGEEEEEESE